MPARPCQARPTLDAIIDQLQREARDGPMEAGEHGAMLMEKARHAAAQLLNAPAASIAFASSGSTAWSMAFQALGAWQPGDRILVGRHEWGGNLASMAAGRAGGCTGGSHPLRCNRRRFCPVALESMIDAQVKLDRPHLAPGQRWLDQPRPGHRRSGQASWHPLLRRRRPSRRPSAGGCTSVAVRCTQVGRSQTPARAARHGAAVRTAGLSPAPGPGPA